VPLWKAELHLRGEGRDILNFLTLAGVMLSMWNPFLSIILLKAMRI
jgi:hypothetical protein